ncbi:MAG: general secretion pathway protein GspB [Massilia sp.]
MSYILEALKKAQAERQLGSAPTIHALPIHAPAQVGIGARRAPLLIGVAALAVLGLAGWWWRAQTPVAPQVAVLAPVVAAPVSPPAAVVQPALVVPAPVAAMPPPPMPPAQMVSPPAPSAPPAPLGPPRAASTSAPIAAAPVLASKPASPPPQTIKPVAAAMPPRASDEPPVPALRELPDAVQRSVPTVTFGGYMYSANPADRLLLVDKVLRHEGEEVAPGLILEKLLPKEAVMNYRGSRYRMAY